MHTLYLRFCPTAEQARAMLAVTGRDNLQMAANEIFAPIIDASLNALVLATTPTPDAPPVPA